MNNSYLLLGSNIGDSLHYLHLAKLSLQKIGCIIFNQSSIYETEAWGNIQQPNFLNQVLGIKTNDSAQQLLKNILHIELELGRKRFQKNDPRTIDIDILFFENEVIDEQYLQVPHPRLHQRRFVLEPINEIAPNFIHPIYKQTIHQLLLNCTDTLDVKKFC